MCTDLRPIEEIYTDDHVGWLTIPQVLLDCLYLAKYENGRFVSDGYFRMAQADRDLIDRWLCEIEHPLALQPSSQQTRIVALIWEYAEKAAAIELNYGGNLYAA